MKILHFADLHLGYEQYGRTNPQTGLNTRLEDFLRAFDKLVDYAIKEKVDLALFAGDAYRTCNPSQTLQREFGLRIMRLREAGIPVFLLVGNHDMPAAMGKAHAVDTFKTLRVPGIVVAETFGAHNIETKAGTVQIVAVPWPERSHLMTREDVKGLTILEVNATVAETLEKAITDAGKTLDPGLAHILAVHTAVVGGDYGSEQSTMLGRDKEVVLSLAEVAKDFDYVALGHLHKHQILRENPPVIYPGSLERVNFGEEADDKGFIVVDIEPNSTTVEFVSTGPREFVTVSLEARGEDPTGQVLAAIRDAGVKDKVVRVIIQTDEVGSARLRENEIREALAEAFYVAGIEKKVERVARLRLGDRANGELTPREMLRLYLQTKETATERMEVLCGVGEAVIAEAA